MYEFHPTLERDSYITHMILWRDWRIEIDVREAEAICTAWRDDLVFVSINLPWGGSPAKWAGIIMMKLRCQ